MKEYQVKIYRGFTTYITLKFPNDGRNHEKIINEKILVNHGDKNMIIDKDTPLLREQTFPDKFGRDKTYTLYYYQWEPSKNQIKLEL